MAAEVSTKNTKDTEITKKEAKIIVEAVIRTVWGGSGANFSVCFVSLVFFVNLFPFLRPVAATHDWQSG